jgi:hypothetical protein
MNWKGFGRKPTWLNRRNIPAGAWTEIRTQNIPNTSLECSVFVFLLQEFCNDNQEYRFYLQLSLDIFKPPDYWITPVYIFYFASIGLLLTTGVYSRRLTNMSQIYPLHLLLK